MEGGEAGIPRVLQRWGSKGLRHRSEHWRGDESEERDGGGAVGTGEGNGRDQVQPRSTLGSNGSNDGGGQEKGIAERGKTSIFSGK